MRFSKVQREYLIEWIAAGDNLAAVKKKAAASEPPFVVSAKSFEYWQRDVRGRTNRAIEEGQEAALKSGLAVRGERVRQLNEMADILRAELLGGKLWVDRVRGIGSGEDFKRVEEQEFNRAELDLWRTLVDDIAREVGGRRVENHQTGEVSVKIDGLAAILEKVYGAKSE